MKRGDIYFIEKGYYETGSEQRAGRPAIIVSNDKNNEHSSVLEVVYLTTQPKTDLPTHVDIRSTAKASVALCEQIHSVYIDRIGDYLATCSEYEMMMVDAALAISLSLNFDEPIKPKPAAPIVEKKAEKVEAVNPECQEKPRNEEPDVIRLKAERDTYKALYDNMVEKLLSKIS